jgi:hypothetical protein
MEAVEMGELLGASSDEAEQHIPAARASKRPLVAGVVVAGVGLALVGVAAVKHTTARTANAGTKSIISMQAYPPPAYTTAPPMAFTTNAGYLPTGSPLQGMCGPKPANPMSTMQRSENMNDGNVCRDSEESFGGLCYRKCACLTNNPKATRMTAFSCCVTDDCTDPTAWDTPTMEFCGGYDTSSANVANGGQGACPHQPGACLEDEEQNFGMCFKKCSLLTNNAYPFRVNAMTCCKEQPSADIMGCEPVLGDDSMYVTGSDYNVGGGCGDGNPTDTPCEPHFPLESQTEGANAR